MPKIKPFIGYRSVERPNWIRNNWQMKSHVFLSASCNEEEVEQFLLVLMNDNQIEMSRPFSEAFDELLQKKHVIINGGVAFIENEQRMIFTSCCCGLEQFQEMVEMIANKESPWLGHDPNPYILFEDQQAMVWSDDPKLSDQSTECFAIHFGEAEIMESMDVAKHDLIGFIEKPLERWLQRLDEKRALKIKKKMYAWFLSTS